MRRLLLEKLTHSFKVNNGIKSIKGREDVLTLKTGIETTITPVEQCVIKIRNRFIERFS